jgi:ribonuclease D
LIALSEALVRSRAREADLAYELLASRADLQAIVAGERTGERADVRTLGGWRRELVGEELLALLDGRLSLAALDQRLLIEPRPLS